MNSAIKAMNRTVGCEAASFYHLKHSRTFDRCGENWPVSFYCVYRVTDKFRWEYVRRYYKFKDFFNGYQIQHLIISRFGLPYRTAGGMLDLFNYGNSGLTRVGDLLFFFNENVWE